MPISNLPRMALRSLALMAFTALGAGTVVAQEAVDNPGRLLASNCFQCHGTNGTPVAGGFDKIAGGSAASIVSELAEMRAVAIAGSEHPIMTVHAQAYSLAEIDLISRYLATVGAVAPTAFTLSITKAGTGSGTVSASGISCGSTCTKTYTKTTKVTLKAAAAKGSVFAGWTGACSGTATSCAVTLAASTTVGATFDLASGTGGGTGGGGTTPGSNVTLKLEKSGRSYGSVVSSPAGIDCGTGCEKASVPMPKNTEVTLTATPVSGRRFVGWSGACRGTAPVCTITLSAQREVKATFK